MTIKSNGTNPTKIRLKKRWDKDRDKWSNNKKYQTEQLEREVNLKAKVGYEKNIEIGKTSKDTKQIEVKRSTDYKQAVARRGNRK